MSREAADACRRAADIIQKRGIAKKVFCDDDNRVCLYGALNLSLFGSAFRLVGESSSQYDEIRISLERRFKVPAALLPGSTDFNDLPDTTAEDVAKVLLQVADELEVG